MKTQNATKGDDRRMPDPQDAIGRSPGPSHTDAPQRERPRLDDEDDDDQGQI